MLNNSTSVCMSDPILEYSRAPSVEIVGFEPIKGVLKEVPLANQGLTFSAPFYVQPFLGKFERMSRNNSSGGRRVWKNWEHYKMLSEITNKSLRVYHPTDVGGSNAIGEGIYGEWCYFGTHQDPLFGWVGYGGADTPYEGLPAMYDPDLPGGWFSPPPVDLESLKMRGLKALLPKMKQELSLVNSLIELKDLKSLARSATKTLLLAKSVLTRTGHTRSLKDAYKVSFRDIKGKSRRFLRGVSEYYLQYAFGILPLVSDICAIYRTVQLAEKRMNRLVANSAKTHVRHYTVMLDEYSPSDEFYVYPLNSVYNYTYPRVVGLNGARRIVTPESSKFHLQIEYNYNYTQYQIEHARLNAFLDSAGILSIPSIVWNAIPWSFVVDWVAGIDQFIAQTSWAASRPVINIHRALWSIKRSRRVTCSRDVAYNSLGLPQQISLPVSASKETSFRRTLWMPTDSSVILSGLNSNEFSLGAALVFSRRKHHKR